MNLVPSNVLDPPITVRLRATAPISIPDPDIRVHSHIASAQPIANAAWHAFLWLVIGNAIGVMLALLLLVPSFNAVLGEWTYGRWMMVHVNILLYGWCSLPMLGWLFRIYGADRGPHRGMVPSCSYGPGPQRFSSDRLHGSPATPAESSFSIGQAMRALRFPAPCSRSGSCWPLLSFSPGTLAATNHGPRTPSKSLASPFLLAVPFAIYVASNPGLYPAVDPSTGGPTGESQLESSLGVVAILLIVPFGVARRQPGRNWPLPFLRSVFAAESLLCLSMNRGDVSHHLPSQYLSLGSLLVWLPIAPAYYATFQWHDNTRAWRKALLWWWGFLVVSGWIMFLPGVLDHFKFTDGLVGHSLIAVAGFLTALLAVVLVQLLGDDGWILTRRWSFHMWNWSVVAYVVLMLIAGWIEGGDPAFTIAPGLTRNIFYTLRLVTGILMLIILRGMAHCCVSPSSPIRRLFHLNVLVR